MDESCAMDELIKALRQPALMNHPDWPAVADMAMPAAISCYYTNEAGDEAYWENVPVLKLDLHRLLLVVEGRHGDPLRLDVRRISSAKNAATGEPVQDLFHELARLWRDTHPE